MSKKSLSWLSILPFMFAGWIFYSMNQSLESYKSVRHFYPESNRVAEGCQDFDAAKNNRSCDEYLNWRKTIISNSRLTIGIALMIGLVQLFLPLITLQTGQSILDGVVMVFTLLVSGAAGLLFFLMIVGFVFSMGTMNLGDLLDSFVEVYQKS
jgi:hypothetical protein